MPFTREILKSERWTSQRLCAFSHLLDRGSLELFKTIQSAKRSRDCGVGWPSVSPNARRNVEVDLRDCCLTIVSNLLLIPHTGVGWIRCTAVAEDLHAAFSREGGCSFRWPFGRATDQAVKPRDLPVVSPELEATALHLCA